jgi:CubicO group peptidase (beta-lactamase class C family)
MRFILICILSLNALVWAAPVKAQNKSRKIDELLKSYYDAGQFNGSAFVVEQGKIIYKKSFGYANFEWKIPNALDTKFRIGSITKSFTAILVLQLAEQEKLKLDDKITNYLPDFSPEIGDKITVRQLLTHNSGLPDYNDVPDFFRAAQSGLLSEADILKRISEYELLFEPGTKFKYSNDGYRVLGAIIEKVTGKSYERVLQENILVPLNMKNSGYINRTAILEKRALGYRKRLGVLENAQYYEASPASGMYSTVDDLYLWQQSLAEDKLLSQKYKDLMWKIVPSGNAYGWLVSERALVKGGQSKLVIKSEGTVFGYFAWTLRIPEDKHLIILLTNIRGATNYLPSINEEIINILYNQPYRKSKISIAETLLPTIRQKGIDAALAQYRELRSKQFEAYNFAETELNALGYGLINIGKMKEAIEIFKFNVEIFPQSANAYDSLAETYLRMGEKELAKRFYKKALEVDSNYPGAKTATEILKNLEADSKPD